MECAARVSRHAPARRSGWPSDTSASTPKITTASARRSASTRPGEASGPVRRRAGLMLHPRRSAESTLSTRRRTASRGPADQGSGAPRHLPRPTAEWQQDPPGSAEVLLPPRVYVEGPSETAHYRHAHHHALTSQPLPRTTGDTTSTATGIVTASSPQGHQSPRQVGVMPRHIGVASCGETSPAVSGWREVRGVSGWRWKADRRKYFPPHIGHVTHLPTG